MFVAIACESGKEVNLGREVLTLEKTKSTPKERDNPPPLAIAVATTRNIIPDTVHSKHSLEDGHQLRFISSSSPLLEKQTLYQYALVLWIAPPFIRHYISTRSFFGLHTTFHPTTITDQFRIRDARNCDMGRAEARWAVLHRHIRTQRP